MKPAERDHTLLLDMLAAGREIRAFIGRATAEEFVADRKTYRAVERLLEIIGEAARRISPRTHALHPAIPWRRVVGLRNRISHEYGDIDYEEIFLIATVSIPELLEVLEPMFAKP